MLYLWYWVVVDIDDFIQVPSDDLCDLKQSLEVKLGVSDKAVESYGGEVAHSYLIRGSVLDYLSAQVAALDSTEVLEKRKKEMHKSKSQLLSKESGIKIPQSDCGILIRAEASSLPYPSR